MTRRSPVTTYPSPIELRRAAERREAVGGAVLACVVVVGFVALGALLIPAPKPPSAPTAAANPSGVGGGLELDFQAVPSSGVRWRTIAVPTHGIGRTFLDDGTTIVTPDPDVQRAQREALDRHPCPGCEP